MSLHPVARALLGFALVGACGCTASDHLRSQDLVSSWQSEPEARLRPPATLVFDGDPVRTLYVCFAGRVYACPEAGAGRTERIWDTGRPITAIAPVGADQGVLLIEASAAPRGGDRVVWLDEGEEPRVLYEASDRMLGTPLRIGTREAWLPSSSIGGDEDTVLITADLMGRRSPELRTAELDAVYHIARDPHSGRTLVSGARRVGGDVEVGLFEVTDEGGRAELVDTHAWAPAWSSHGEFLATARGRREAGAASLRYGPTADCSIRIESERGDVQDVPVDGVVLALCFDPADETLLFAALGDADEVRTGELRTVRVQRVRIGRGTARGAEIARIIRDGD